MMYESLDSMWTHVVSELLRADPVTSRDGDTTELLGYSAKLLPQECWLTNEGRRLSPIYAAGEILWYVSGGNSISHIAAYAPSYTKFSEGGVAHGAYGARIFSPYGDSVERVINALKSDQHSRRCVVSIWDHHDLYRGHGVDASKDVPCTLTWQFLIRNGRLHMIVTMRSQDVWLGMPYDVFWNCTVQRLVANSLGLGVGMYTHQCGSIHLYDRNRVLAEVAIHAKSTPEAAWTFAHDTWAEVVEASKHERDIRLATTNKASALEAIANYPDSSIRKTLLAIARGRFEVTDLSGIDKTLALAYDRCTSSGRK